MSQPDHRQPRLTSHYQARLGEPLDALSWTCLLRYFGELSTLFTPPETQTCWPDSSKVRWGPSKSLGCTGTSARPTPVQALWVWHTGTSVLHLWCGHHQSMLGRYGLDIKLCWGPLCPFYPHRAQYRCFEPVITHFSPASNLHLTATAPSAAARLLFKSGAKKESFPLVLTPLSKEEKEGKEIQMLYGRFGAPPFSGTVCLAQAISVLTAYFYTSWTLGTACSAVASTPIAFTQSCVCPRPHIPKVRLVCVPEQMHESKQSQKLVYTAFNWSANKHKKTYFHTLSNH